MITGVILLSRRIVCEDWFEIKASMRIDAAIASGCGWRDGIYRARKRKKT